MFQTELENDLEKKKSEKMNDWLKRLKLWHAYLRRQILLHERTYDKTRLKIANRKRSPMVLR